MKANRVLDVSRYRAFCEDGSVEVVLDASGDLCLWEEVEQAAIEMEAEYNAEVRGE